MVKILTIGILALVAVILIYAATGPDAFRVRRSTAIKVPPLISKLIRLFCTMEKIIGKNFEAGLASLKTVAEKQAVGDTP